MVADAVRTEPGSGSRLTLMQAVLGLLTARLPCSENTSSSVWWSNLASLGSSSTEALTDLFFLESLFCFVKV